MKIAVYLTVIPGQTRVCTTTLPPTNDWIQQIKRQHPGAKVYRADVELPAEEPAIDGVTGGVASEIA